MEQNQTVTGRGTAPTQLAIEWVARPVSQADTLVTWHRIALYANLDERWCRRLSMRADDPFPVLNYLAENARVCSSRAAIDAWKQRQHRRRDRRRRVRPGVEVAA